jgi:hypothetical protein
MRLLFPLALGLAACGFEPGAFTSIDAGDGGGGGGDASDAAIDSQTLDAFVDVDSDGDGVLAGADNCPTVSNADQRNHDGDPFGDACDRCPHLASTTDPDADEDGIGDACDPRPQTAGDTRVLWDGFYDDTGFQAWNGSGAWSVSGGMLRQTSTTNDLAFVYPPGAIARHAVTAGVRIDTIGTVNGNYVPSFAVAGGTSGSTQGYYCGMVSGASTRVYAWGFWPVTQSVYDTGTWSGTFAAGSLFTATGQILGGNHTCTLAQGATATPINQAHGTTTGFVVLATSRLAASFDYVFVVAIGE